MDPMISIALWWAAAIAGHIVLSSDILRPRLVAAVGKVAYQGIYSVVALGAFVPLFSVALDAVGQGEELWDGGMTVRVITSIIVTVAFFLLGHGVTMPAPSLTMFEGTAKARGALRITRHPVSAAFFLLGIGHILANGMPADIVFFAGFSVFAWLTTWHQDRRKRREVDGYEAVWAETSFVPFVAIARGQQSLGQAFAEMRGKGWAVGLILLTVVYVLHGRMFGATPHGWGL